MKKYITIIALILGLSGCIRAGDFDLLPFRKSVINSVRGYYIHDFDDDLDSGSIEVKEDNAVMNKALTAGKGESILSNKFYNRLSHEHISFIPNKNGSLSNITYTLNLDARKDYDVDYWVKIDGTRYYLLSSNVDGYFYLFDDEGNFFDRGGIDKDGFLQLLPDEIMVYPSDLKMEKVIKSRDEIGNVYKGYEVKYSGIDLDRIWFDYLDYDDGTTSGNFERISFPNKPGLITINGKGIRVIRADDKTITYMILKNED